MYKLGTSSRDYEEKLQQGARPTIKHELALVRTMLQATIDQADSVMEFVVQSDKVLSQVEQIRKTVETFHKLEEASGNMLHASEVQEIIQAIQKVIVQNCTPQVSGLVMQVLQDLL